MLKRLLPPKGLWRAGTGPLLAADFCLPSEVLAKEDLLPISYCLLESLIIPAFILRSGPLRPLTVALCLLPSASLRGETIWKLL